MNVPFPLFLSPIWSKISDFCKRSNNQLKTPSRRKV